VGQVRFDIKEGESAEIDVSIDKERRGLGYGKLLLELAAAELFQTTSVRTIDSFIKIENIKSIRAFEKAKYKRIGPLVMHGEQSVRYVKERGD
jgi:UDP-2,4-diacetamido-2,4,6-trideoxy-beta-L-altropyranose hydrolase